LLLPALSGRSVQGFADAGFARLAGRESGSEVLAAAGEPLSAVTGQPA